MPDKKQLIFPDWSKGYGYNYGLWFKLVQATQPHQQEEFLSDNAGLECVATLLLHPWTIVEYLPLEPTTAVDGHTLEGQLKYDLELKFQNVIARTTWSKDITNTFFNSRTRKIMDQFIAVTDPDMETEASKYMGFHGLELEAMAILENMEIITKGLSDEYHLRFLTGKNVMFTMDHLDWWKPLVIFHIHMSYRAYLGDGDDTVSGLTEYIDALNDSVKVD